MTSKTPFFARPVPALRFGFLYGPGTALAEDGAIAALIRKRQLPIVGDGGGIWSFIHIIDAARATAAAISRGKPGIYNIVDDDPAPVSTWLPFLADDLGARPPWKIPAWIARFIIGDGGVSMMTRIAVHPMPKPNTPLIGGRSTQAGELDLKKGLVDRGKTGYPKRTNPGITIKQVEKLRVILYVCLANATSESN